ncbi:MAG TPA: hypothetical protein VKU39_09620, partial [Streptosporangiaceae bacterium]|nr:hypothetical protein [Streptosporangiaceae bacterium]
MAAVPGVPAVPDVAGVADEAGVAARPASGAGLLPRLWQRADRPGRVRIAQAAALATRHTRIAAPSPLVALLTRRAQDPAPLIVPALPVVTSP